MVHENVAYDSKNKTNERKEQTTKMSFILISILNDQRGRAETLSTSPLIRMIKDVFMRSGARERVDPGGASPGAIVRLCLSKIAFETQLLTR